MFKLINGNNCSIYFDLSKLSMILLEGMDYNYEHKVKARSIW